MPGWLLQRASLTTEVSAARCSQPPGTSVCGLPPQAVSAHTVWVPLHAPLHAETTPGAVLPLSVLRWKSYTTTRGRQAPQCVLVIISTACWLFFTSPHITTATHQRSSPAQSLPSALRARAASCGRARCPSARPGRSCCATPPPRQSRRPGTPPQTACRSQRCLLRVGWGLVERQRAVCVSVQRECELRALLVNQRRTAITKHTPPSPVLCREACVVVCTRRHKALLVSRQRPQQLGGRTRPDLTRLDQCAWWW